MPEDGQPIPGARPIRPGDLEGLWRGQKQQEIAQRARYLVNDDLEEPPHIRQARIILQQKGGDWRTASEDEYVPFPLTTIPHGDNATNPLTQVSIIKILDQLPRALFESNSWPRRPHPPPTSPYHDLMTRIHQSELQFYGFDSTSPGGTFLHMLRDARTDPSPASFYRRLRRANLTITKVVHFTRDTVLSGPVQRLSLPLRLEVRRNLFVADLARFLALMQKRSIIPGDGAPEPLPLVTYAVPDARERYLEEGILKLEGGSFVYDTTLNGSVLRVIREADVRPAVIMKELVFWRDGADQDAEAAARAAGL